jgi:hypothetical protein
VEIEKEADPVTFIPTGSTITNGHTAKKKGLLFDDVDATPTIDKAAADFHQEDIKKKPPKKKGLAFE